MHLFSQIFIIMLVISISTQFWLIRRQIHSVLNNRGQVPPPFDSKISLSAHQKAADYTITKIRVGTVDLVFSTLLLLCWTLGGGLELLDNAWRSLDYSPIVTGIAVIISAVIISQILDLPLSLYSTFVIEERFGFNKMTPALYFIDMIKSMMIGLIIGVPILWLVLWLMQPASGTSDMAVPSFDSLWWLYVWLVWFGFSLFMMWAYPAFIAPLFNKFKPLEDTDLKQRIEALMTRTGFTSSGIFIMDGSRRSGHGNAYFTGLGANKRIVFYDTLIESLTPEEIEAVLAHELGHFKRRHIHKRILSMAAMSLAGLALLGWLISQQWFYTGLGVTQASSYMALMLFMFAMPVFTFFLSPIMMKITRKHEFEADDFAAEQADANELIKALVKMYEENASTLTPDALYSAFHDSHPPAPVRVAHLATKMG